jgi:hypothetical protein
MKMVLSEVVEKIFEPAGKWNRVCDRCPDARKAQPVVGMVILSNLSRERVPERVA